MDQSRFLSRLPALLAGPLLLLSAGAFGIQRSGDGTGQYLIVPFAIAANGYETVLEISDTLDTVAQALKLRILDRDGQPRLTANLYLKGGATWAGGLTRQDGTARLLTASDSCLLIERDDAVEPSSQVDFEFTAGSVEVVEMGVVDEQALSTAVSNDDCQAIADLWNDGSWAPEAALTPPDGGLRATARVVNVGKGTFYGVPVTALKHFSDIAQHTAPSTAQPDLASTHDEGTQAGETRSVVCDDDGCVEDFWDNPIDAASAALMTYTARDTYDISESLNARSEWIVTYPTQAHHDDSHRFSSALVSVGVFDRGGSEVPGPTYVLIPEQIPSFKSPTTKIIHKRSVMPIDLGAVAREPGEIRASTLFGLAQEVTDGDNYISRSRLPNTGQVRLGFESFTDSINAIYQHVIVANSGRRYSGRPALVVPFVEYTHGVLPGNDGQPQRANYGSSGEVSTTVRIDPPFE